MRKLLIMLMIVFVGISLTACKNDEAGTVEYNKNVPVGQLSATSVYATAANGKYTISELELYNEMRVNGYDYFFEEILNILVKPENLGLDVNNENVKKEVKKIIDKKCFGTDDEKEINKLTAEARATAIKQFKDQLFLMNVNYIKDNSYDRLSEEFYDSIANHFLKQYAQKVFAINELKNSNSKFYYKNEYQMENGTEVLENGKKVPNAYYIDEETIKNNYENEHNETAYYEVVILASDTLADAINLIEEKDLTDADGNDIAFEAFKAAYKKQNDYKGEVTATTFQLTDKDLSIYNQTLISVIKNMKAGEYKLYQQFGSKVYSIYLKSEKPEVDFSKLTDDVKTTLVDKILDKQSTETVVSTILIDKVYNTEIVIYDHVFDALYAAENSKHTRLAASQWTADCNDKVADVKHTVNGVAKVTPIMVKDFYGTLESILGLTTALDYFSSKMLLDSDFANKLTFDEAETIVKDFNKTMAEFHKGAYEGYGYPASIGEDVFKFVYFGNTNDEEILQYFKSQKAWSHYVEDRPDNYASILYNLGKNYKENFFDLSVKHILVTVDYDQDGTADDPELFVQKVANKAAFEQAVIDLLTAVTKEVDYIVNEKKHASMVDALDYILKSFYAGDQLLSDSTKHWSDYRKFGLGLTIEDLGSVNNNSASRYVKEFGLGVKDLYKHLTTTDMPVEKEGQTAKKYITDGKLNKDFLDTRFTAEGLTLEEQMNKLIKTTYGYHILTAYKTSAAPSAKYEESDDNSKQFKEVVIKVDGVEKTTNAYNPENDWASLNQIEIYLAQVNTDYGVTGLPSVVKTYINNYYSLLETDYKNDTFRNILYAETEIKIDFASDANDDKYANFMDIQKRKYDAYADNENTVDLLANLWDLAFIEPIQ